MKKEKRKVKKIVIPAICIVLISLFMISCGLGKKVDNRTDTGTGDGAAVTQ